MMEINPSVKTKQPAIAGRLVFVSALFGRVYACQAQSGALEEIQRLGQAGMFNQHTILEQPHDGAQVFPFRKNNSSR
jgi:hypothetical protein